MPSNLTPDDHADLLRRIERDLVDGYDEELELEIEDRELDGFERPPGSGDSDDDRSARQRYFRELFRLQAELVKLQDWVAHTRHKVVILFEGRDAAGKGGVIKRITQRLNPRVCRVVALPAPNDRERTQWYFQRYVSLTCRLPARWFCSTAAGTTGPASSG
jgi:polyphosphate kinase 2 (PPK2 family)